MSRTRCPKKGLSPLPPASRYGPALWPSVTTPWRLGALRDGGEGHPGGGEHPLRTDADFCVNELFRLRTKRDKPPLRKRRRIDISSSTQCVDGRIRLRVVYAAVFASCRFRVVFAAFGVHNKPALGPVGDSLDDLT
jgi:hypothetical protein